jgi:hypothetical protein
MKNEKKLNLRNPWLVLALTFVYILIMDLYFHYCINSEVDMLLQTIATFVAIYYTWWQLHLIVTTLIESITKKIKEEK